MWIDLIVSFNLLFSSFVAREERLYLEPVYVIARPAFFLINRDLSGSPKDI